MTTRRSVGFDEAFDVGAAARGATIHAIPMLSRYRTTIGAANTRGTIGLFAGNCLKASTVRTNAWPGSRCLLRAVTGAERTSEQRLKAGLVERLPMWVRRAAPGEDGLAVERKKRRRGSRATLTELLVEPEEAIAIDHPKDSASGKEA